jgi:hypothetical protein
MGGLVVYNHPATRLIVAFIALRLAGGWSVLRSIAAKPLMDRFLHRFKRAKTPKVQDGGSHPSAGGSALPALSQPSTSTEAREIQSKQNVTESQEQVESRPRANVEGVPKGKDSSLQAKDVDGSATVSTPVAFQDLSLDLWNQAFESLKTKNAALVEIWETILSEQMTLEGMLRSFSFALEVAPMSCRVMGIPRQVAVAFPSSRLCPIPPK